ncbi:hypothetical protein BN2476_960091 [Paraburkholderia piptadeniae]|uniref:Uncharacterized protein n=1 Tax=Paraburkholderia piptadeniae TaxID=1701573 RepID=A0A1N7SU81_9BURK|nr:hypothetical protein BN2476_960091 [Paraburkholderia piptadeniae]
MKSSHGTVLKRCGFLASHTGERPSLIRKLRRLFYSLPGVQQSLHYWPHSQRVYQLPVVATNQCEHTSLTRTSRSLSGHSTK